MAKKITSVHKKVISEFGQKYGPAMEPAIEFVMRLRERDDETAIILKGHMTVEYLLDRIIESKCKSPTVIVNDSRTYTFLVKLQLVYAMGFLPDYIYENIVLLNRFRNKVAHSLEVDIALKEMVFKSPNKLERLGQKGKKIPAREDFRIFCFGILLQLSGHMMTELGIDLRRS